MPLLNTMPQYTLFGIDNPSYKNAEVVVLPVPYDSTTSYKAGARDGPHAIIEASRNMELYSEELCCTISDLISVRTEDELMPNVDSPEKTVEMIADEVSRIVADAKLPLILGGEHTVAIGGIRGVGRHTRDFTVLHFDAHADSRETFMGSRYSHACVIARAREVAKRCYSIGVRSIDADGARLYGGAILYRKEMRAMSVQQATERILEHCGEAVYLTLDADVLDPGEMPAVGTPEPDGLGFHELTQILKGVLAKRRLVGADFTELSPIPGMHAPNYLIAKLIYLTLGYALIKRADGRATPASL